MISLHFWSGTTKKVNLFIANLRKGAQGWGIIVEVLYDKTRATISCTYNYRIWSVHNDKSISVLHQINSSPNSVMKHVVL